MFLKRNYQNYKISKKKFKSALNINEKIILIFINKFSFMADILIDHRIRDWVFIPLIFVMFMVRGIHFHFKGEHFQILSAEIYG